MNRSDFIQSVLGVRQMPMPKPTGGLDPYSGPWTTTEAIHLLRRLTFGAKPKDVRDILKQNLSQALDKLLVVDPIPSPPVNIYSDTTNVDPDVKPGETFINAPLNLTLPPQFYQARTDVLKAWIMGNMINQNTTITEKLLLFWHNHFAIEADTVQLAQTMYHYFKLLRENSLGNFKTLVLEISRNTAMLKYLNGEKNSKNAPDENYGRELQELFTIGKGPDSHYTESDVKAAARILTGFTVDYVSSVLNKDVAPLLNYKFNWLNHDTGNKQFSSFYNNKTITGKGFGAGEDELKELVDMLLANIETARHICRKIYRFFVYYEITNDVEQTIIRPLADYMVAENYDIKKVLRKLFSSQHFFDIANIGCVIKNPLDFSIGLCREFGIQLPDNSNVTRQYLGWGSFAALSAYQGLNIADPPLVAGWQAWYQAPQYHEIWINADTLANRNRVVENLNSPKGIDFNGVILKIDPIPFTSALSDPSNALKLVTESVQYLYNVKLSDASLNYFKSFLITGYPDDSYWTQAWLDYTANPNDASLRNVVASKLSNLFREMLSQAEYHLS